MNKLFIIVAATLLLGGCTLASGKISDKAVSTDMKFPTEAWVTDEPGILSDKAFEELTTKLTNFKDKAEIAVVVIPTTQPYTVEQYSIKLAEKWRVGKSGVDNGILFVIVTQDRKLRIEVGRGLEGKITDAKAGKILDTYVVPELKNGNWEAGIIKGSDAIMEEIK